VYEKRGCVRIAVQPVHGIVAPQVFEIPRYAEFVGDPMGGSRSVAVALVALNLDGEFSGWTGKGRVVKPHHRHLWV